MLTMHNNAALSWEQVEDNVKVWYDQMVMTKL